VVRAEAAARLRPRPIAAHPYTLLDVFTDRPLAGNGLAVVHDADPLSDATMHAFARETKLSETSFVQTAERGADYRHRIFMMNGEIPFAGHPSLGVAVAVARARGESPVTYVQQTQAGEQAIDVELDGLRASVSMLQEPPAFGPELDPDEVLGLVGLDGEQADPALPCQVVSTGVAQVLVCVSDAAVLRRVLPAYDRIGRLLGQHGAVALYLAAVDVEAGTARARSFLRTAEMGEDPATGSAVGPLCAHVAARTGVERLEVDQGVEMGRPSRLVASLDGDRVRVGGDAVILAEGTVHLLDT
jgi:trans-2,3-dihydro-3-hydroxyanthranilate isomerase